MAHNEDQPQTSEELVPVPERLQILSNNFVFDADVTKTNFPILGEILRAHPYYHMLRHEPSVTLIYVHQVWNSLQVEQGEDGKDELKGELGQYDMKITESSFRKSLRLSRRRSRADEGLTSFEASPSKDEISAMMVQLGYNGDFPQPLSKMKRSDIAALWCTLLTIINKCTTWKHTGYDKYSANTVSIFLAIAFHRHYDMAKMIFSELIQLVKDKKTKKAKTSIPFPRFLAMGIE